MFLVAKFSMYESCTKIIYKLLYSRFYLASSRQQQKEAEIISEILLKAASEPEFRNILVKDPGVVLEQYDVSPEAKLIIKRSIVDLTQ
jgi:hypothetical protein